MCRIPNSAITSSRVTYYISISSTRFSSMLDLNIITISDAIQQLPDIFLQILFHVCNFILKSDGNIFNKIFKLVLLYYTYYTYIRLLVIFVLIISNDTYKSFRKLLGLYLLHFKECLRF